MSRNLSCGFDYLTNGVAYAVAEVENVALAAVIEILHSKNMGLCKVGKYPKWIKMIVNVCPDITSGQVCFCW